MRILFICKKNECYGFKTKTRRSAGLYNSTRFIVESLESRGVQAHIIEVIDNNCIDREVTKYKPDIVVIEALWVVPDKFDILKKLHPKVRWYVHLHSHMAFLALEGIAIEWLRGCARRGVTLIANSIPSYEALRTVLGKKDLIYLPNVYLSKPREARLGSDGIMNVACLGAVRPLKNQLLQAMAALRFAREKKRYLIFYMNVTRSETGGDPVLKNIRELFNDSPYGCLYELDWLEPNIMLDLLQNHIDLGMQVSLTETFNVVTADYVTAGIPIVVSKEVAWASRWSKAQDDSIQDIVKTMHLAWQNRKLIRWNQHLLLKFSNHAQKMWFEFVK